MSKSYNLHEINTIGILAIHVLRLIHKEKSEYFFDKI